MQKKPFNFISKSYISIFAIILLTSCFKERRYAIKDLSGDYDVAIFEEFVDINGILTFDTTYSIGSIEKVSRCQIKFIDGQGGDEIYYSLNVEGDLVRIKDNDFNEGSFYWDAGVLRIVKEEYTASHSYRKSTYAVKH